MATVPFNKYQVTITDFTTGQHTSALQADTDVIKIALTNTAPNAATHQELTDITEISAGNGYTAGGEDIQNAATTATGTISVAATNVVWTASGGAIADFRYVVLHNATAGGLLGWWDYGSTVSLADGETFTVQFGATVFTLA